MDQLQRLRSRPALVVLACGAVVAAASAADAAKAATVLDLVSGVPSGPTVDLGSPGRTPGDLWTFSSTVTDPSGGPVGRLLGTQTTIAAGAAAQSAQGALTFDLADGQIVVGGTSSLALDSSGLIPAVAFDRAVLGGSGRFAGVRGVLTSTRRADGTYAQRFVLTPAATTGGRTLDLFSGGSPVGAVDHPPAGASPGDEKVIDTPLTDGAGTAVGTLRGTQTVMAVDADAQTAQAALTFTTPRVTIVVGGVTQLPVAGGGTLPGVALTRPVLGGTGAYAGMSGTDTVTRDGERYRNHFALTRGTGAARRPRTIPAIGANGAPAEIDLTPAGISTGDLYVFSGTFTTRAGRRLGTVHGTQTVAAIGPRELTMSSTLTYALRGRGQIVVGGLAPYATETPDGTVRLRPVQRAVLGGTGEFAGAHGTMRAVRRADGTYWLTFSLLGAPSRNR
jgi:hypothetical protein